MDKSDIILWVVSGGFTLMLIFWNTLNNRIEASEKTILTRFDRVDARMDKMDEKLTDMDRRLCRLEGAFSNKDCCVIKESQTMRKAE